MRDITKMFIQELFKHPKFTREYVTDETKAEIGEIFEKFVDQAFEPYTLEIKRLAEIITTLETQLESS